MSGIESKDRTFGEGLDQDEIQERPKQLFHQPSKLYYSKTDEGDSESNQARNQVFTENEQKLAKHRFYSVVLRMPNTGD